MPDLSHSLRKAAILLSCLEPDQAGGVLARIGGRDAAQLRDAVALLGPITATERNTVIREFLRLTSQNNLDASGVELGGQLARRLAAQSEHATPVEPGSVTRHEIGASPFAFLMETEPEVVAPFLSQESPQTVAVALSFLERRHASAILQCLDPALQAQVVQRLASLDDVAPDSVEVVATELRAWLERQAAQQESQEASIAPNSRHDGEAESTASDEGQLPARASAVPHPRPDMSFQDLESLADTELLEVLGAAPAEVLALALADAGETLLRRITNKLPRRDAKRLRKSIQLQGPTRLADIEAAQQNIARLASRVISAGQGRY